MATAAKKTPAKRTTKPTPAQVAAVTRRGDRIVQFIEKYVYVPEGALVGKPMVLLPEQKEFISAVYDNVTPAGRLRTRRGIFSIARKNGKSGLIAALLEAHIIGPETKMNGQLYSAARSRDQAALIFNYAAKSLRMNPKLDGLVQITDSGKKIQGLVKNVMYKALSADATTAHGLSPALTIHDELGQVVGPTDPLYDALETAGGAQEEPLSLIISTQAANDADLLSIIIDDGIRNPTPETVVRLYAAAKEDDIFDERVWYKTNFALGIFRSYSEFREMAERAKRMPSSEATFRNLYLNMRIALQSLLVPPNLWKENDRFSDDALFTSGLPVHVALDLSQRTDLTAAVCSVQNPDDGVVHLKPFVYTPSDGIEERSKVDRAPYDMWAKQGYLIPTGGRIVDYEQVMQHLVANTKDMNIASINFDRWRIELLRKEAEKVGWCTDETIPWRPVGQGFKDMSPCIESFETLLLNGMLAHGNHPLLNLGAANAIAVRDPANNRKLEKARSTGRIDPLVAAIMSVHACVSPPEGAEGEISHAESDFFIG
jgi:phage terminase large subunit-like protein